ncbi:hypothetical protein [Ruegeria aquimaris]|uniref:Uncharacterized protein n=1 Tax=Ruegeria aquimaris TaxID=2984333 RepID=A0ABT3AR61_9RHOB|nr:hypothetical protein [Ruegeria sp. XHP0148]MCV2891179.1 hypothetical protein [Ruegeria sp. XHP0148]
MSELSNDQKRMLIYTDERLKELDIEYERLEKQRGVLDASKSLSENEKRFRIYIADRLPQLTEERRDLVTARRKLTET